MVARHAPDDGLERPGHGLRAHAATANHRKTARPPSQVPTEWPTRHGNDPRSCHRQEARLKGGASSLSLDVRDDDRSFKDAVWPLSTAPFEPRWSTDSGRRDALLIGFEEREQLVGGILAVVATLADLVNHARLRKGFQTVEGSLM